MSSQRQTDGVGRTVIVILAVIVLLPALTMLVAFPMMGLWGGGMMGSYSGMMGYDGYGVSPLWSLGMLLVWLVVLLGGGYLAYKWLAGNEGGSADPALEELRLAYARGDISEEEFEERRARLGEE